MSDTALLTLVTWIVAAAIWATLLIPQSSKLASWFRATFNLLRWPLDRMRIFRDR